jgi:hypothetical protein
MVELDEYFVVYMFNFAHMSAAVTIGFPRDVCMNLMCLPSVFRFTVRLVYMNLMCVWYIPDSLRDRNMKSFCKTIWLVCWNVSLTLLPSPLWDTRLEPASHSRDQTLWFSSVITLDLGHHRHHATSPPPCTFSSASHAPIPAPLRQSCSTPGVWWWTTRVPLVSWPRYPLSPPMKWLRPLVGCPLVEF